MRTPLRVCLFLLLALASAGHAQQGAAPAPSGLSAEETDLLARVKTETVHTTTLALTAPEMEGRGTGQPGGDRAARYLADRFKALGLKPAGDNNDFLQAIRFGETQRFPTSALRISGGETLTFGTDFYYISSRAVEVKGPLIFVGFGVSDEQFHRDDYKGIDVRGKIVALLNGHPDALPDQDKQQWQFARARSSLQSVLLQKGALAVLNVPASTTRNPQFDSAALYTMRRQIGWNPNQKVQRILTTPLLPEAYVGASGAAKLWAKSGTSFESDLTKAKTGAFVSRLLAPSASLSFQVKTREVTASNVVGILEGSDPVLKNEAVTFIAHYDAFGKAVDGTIYPGAADNAVGVGELMGLAEALATGPRPKRSIVFLCPTAEEYGLLGTRHYLQHPAFPIAKTVATFAFDGIGTETRGPVRVVVGYGREYSTLGQTLQSVTANLSCLLIPDPLPQEQTFFRSDHFAFVEKGVPSLFVLGAPGGNIAATLQRAQTFLATDYHQPTDTVHPDWNWDGPRSLSALVLLTGWRVLQAPTAPEWLPSSPYQRPK